MTKPRIGFIGQGFIGKNMANDFENRGYDVVRYSLEDPYIANKDAITDCDITFIAVPTPTTPDGFDTSFIRSVIPLIGEGTCAVIKSTILPGTTESLQTAFPNIYIMHSPEFLRETSAAEDSAHPDRNIIGIAKDDKAHKEAADRVMNSLPSAPYELITSARNAECIKYIGNAFLYTKLVFMNLAYDFVEGATGDWETVREAVVHDNRIGTSHTSPIGKDGRGAGGHCFIKDFQAFIDFYEKTVKDPSGLTALEAWRDKNNELLLNTQKDLDLLRGVYGDNI